MERNHTTQVKDNADIVTAFESSNLCQDVHSADRVQKTRSWFHIRPDERNNLRDPLLSRGPKKVEDLQWM